MHAERPVGQAASSSAPLQHITQTGRTGYIRPLLHLSSHLCTGRSCRQLEMPGKPLPHLWAADAPAGHAVVGGGHPPPESPSDLRHSLSPETCPECSSGCPELWVLWAPRGLAHSALPHRRGDDIVVLIRGLPPGVPAPLNGGNEGPRDKASLVPAATSEWTESPLCAGAPCPPSPCPRRTCQQTAH